MIRTILFLCFLPIVASGIDMSVVDSNLTAKFKTLYSQQSAAEQNKWNDSILHIFKTQCNNTEAFEYPFDSLKIGKITSSDQKVRMFTWNIPTQFGTHKYWAVLMYRDDNKKVNLKVLKGNKTITQDDEHKMIPMQSWYGCLYYDIIYVKQKETTNYLLLGYDLHNYLTKKKIIDVLHIDEYGYINFGKPILVEANKRYHRKVYEYGAGVQMNMRYSEDDKRIVFDHLSPMSDSYKGKYQFYGPDFTFDAFTFTEGMWMHESDVDVRNTFRVIEPVKNTPPRPSY